MTDTKFQKAMRREPLATPPIWFMRQAGRYHSHYRALREKNSFMDLCKVPELAAEVAMGPIQDFDFDVAILFSDLLFPLEGFGLGLEYTDEGPRLGWHIRSESDLSRLKPVEEAVETVRFQEKALRLTRERLPKDKALIGFVGGPWTLFSYAVQGRHEGGLLESKKHLPLFAPFCRKLVPLLIRNIEIQFAGGADAVMIFDTAAGELSSEIYRAQVIPELEEMARAFPGRLGYYSRGTGPDHLRDERLIGAPWAGLGVDHRWSLGSALALRRSGFLQGNFDQALLHMELADFEAELLRWLAPLEKLGPAARAGWVCGLGHGVLPKTPEGNVRRFVQLVRERLS